MTDLDDALQFKKLSVVSMPNAGDHGKRISVHSFTRLTSIPDNDVQETEEFTEDKIPDEDQAYPNNTNNYITASAHM